MQFVARSEKLRKPKTEGINAKGLKVNMLHVTESTEASRKEANAKL